MPDALSMALRVATTPIWALWRGYLLVWWAFDDSSERAAARLSAKTTAAADIPPPRFVEGGDSGQASSFEFTDSRPVRKPAPPPMPVPTGLLRGGFAGSLVLCSFFAMLTGGLAASDAISGVRATALWTWGCAILVCTSVLLVRKVARKRWEKPKGPVARMKDACVGAAKGACAGVRQRMASFIPGRARAARAPQSHRPNPNPSPEGVRATAQQDVPRAEAMASQSPYGAAAFRGAVKNLVPAVARGARGVLDPLRDRASKGLAWAAEKSKPGSNAA